MSHAVDDCLRNWAVIFVSDGIGLFAILEMMYNVDLNYNIQDQML